MVGKNFGVVHQWPMDGNQKQALVHFRGHLKVKNTLCSLNSLYFSSDREIRNYSGGEEDIPFLFTLRSK